MKIITIILGVLLAIGGVYCIITPIATYSAISWLIGISMVAEGIARIILWSDLRKAGLANGWTLAGAIVSVLLGIFLLGSFVAQIAVDIFIAYLIAVWLVVAGITRIAVAVSLRREENQGAGTSNWVALLAFGVLLIILGLLCVFNPTAVMVGVGFLLGLSITLTGVGLVATAIRA